MSKISSLFSFVAALSLLAGCVSGWPSGHVCDQELPITFSGMLAQGIPNEDGKGFSPLLGDPCDNQDYDDDGVPAGGDWNDVVNEYDWDLEGEDEGWMRDCIQPKLPGDRTPYTRDTWVYEFDEGCHQQWRQRLEEACARWEAGDLQGHVAPEDREFEENSYQLYCPP